MPSRSELALGEPGDDLSGFPARTIRRNTPLYRAHSLGNGPWWFSNDGNGRFDLRAPEGTCYVADQSAAALRERLGPRVVRSGTVLRDELQQTLVSRVSLPAPAHVANTAHPDAYVYRCTTEISTVVDYGLTNRWATAFRRDGWMGVRYTARLATGAMSVALFGTAGEPGWPDDPHPVPGTASELDVGLKVVDTPTPASLTFVSPPTA